MKPGGDSALPVADRLTHRAVPFIVMAGYGNEVVRPGGHAGIPAVLRPFDPQHPAQVLRCAVLRRRR
jgi:hypothetical protein